ncbi:MAG: aldo/keto reductase [Intrasporangium sp.]|uniref:aldo/keto reductase n=1 Tax=Intrasporangium sp. TaxID=1925024 RepID=UPI002647DDEF|nr:aldo/keto reductase [Intrasporangium sp.]MDN5796698.1 aldo/keto reductase [Intrasporangium sp.]
MSAKLPVRMVPLGHASTPGLAIPQLGFGVWEVPDDQVDAAFGAALDTGYRHIDTAEMYRNEEGVGRVLTRAGIARDDIFITTKVWYTHLDRVQQAFDASLQRLGLDVLDLYLIHWPAPGRDEYVGGWEQLLELQRSGRVRSVGVCNFHVPHLQRLLDATGVLPSVNQVELSPYLQQRELRAFHAEHGIVTEAWSPLAAGAGLLQDPAMTRIADKHAVTRAQVALRWQLQLGNVVLTRSVKTARIAQNADLFAFDLDEDDLAAIASLDRGERTGPNPDEFGA